MINYNIRAPKDKEILKSISLLYSAFGRSPPKNIEKEEKTWKELIKREIGKFLISEENGKLFGVGGAFLFKRVCSFGYMAVLPEYRGKGVGTEIFSNLLEIANNMNCETMILYASKLGKPIYKKFGFQERFYGIMYQLPTRLGDFEAENKDIKVIGKIPEWLLTLDKRTMGFDRRQYLKMKVELGAKILVVENEGYGLITNDRLGPLIAINEDTALQIIKRGIVLGANHSIIPSHEYFPNRIIQLAKFTKSQSEASLKMVYGKDIAENLKLLYAIGTYAKG